MGVVEKLKADATISIRIPAQTRDLIDTAAAATGRSRSDFMIESARLHAVDVLLDQRVFNLDAAGSEAFAAALANPAEPNAAMRKLMSTPAPWE